MTVARISRRQWLMLPPLGASWAAVLAAQQHAHQVMQGAPATLTFFSREEAFEISAIASQIIPSDGSPGAREAGVVYFIDRALSTFDAAKRGPYSQGLRETQQRRAAMFPGSKSIAELKAEQQIQLLRAIENTDFFEQVRTHSIVGFFGNPSYGGNRNQAGWKLIGFEDKFQFEPPFGYYDGPGEEKE